MPIANTRRADDQVSTAPFTNAEQAWFWFIRCQQVRRDGARLKGSGTTDRPCDPDDIYCAVIRLARSNVLKPSHLRVLGQFGLRGCPPDRRCRDEQQEARLWDEALDRLTTILRRKGIVA